jgi:hypothetical protein
MKRKGLAQPRIPYMRGDGCIDRSPGALSGERGRRLEHRGEIEKRHRAQFHIAFGMNRFGIAQKALVACDVGRVEGGNLTAQRGFVIAIIEMAAVGPLQAVEGRNGQERDIGRHIGAGEPPKLRKAGGVGNDRRSRVEGEAVALPNIGAAARPVARFDKVDGNAGRLEANGQRQPAYSGSDHDCPAHR